MHQVCPPKQPNMKSLGDIVIRAAGRGDEEEILRCLAAAFEPYRAEYTPEAYADTVLDQASLKKRLQYMYVLVAVASEGIVGTVAASLVNGEGHLRGMAVRPEWRGRSEEHTSELQSRGHLVCRLLLEKKKQSRSYILYIMQKQSNDRSN